jgi:protein TonB
MRPDRAGLGITVALHALALVGLISYEPARKALLAAAPIMVDLITLPKVETRLAPPTELPKPNPVAKTASQAVAPMPILAAPAEAPAPAAAPQRESPRPVAAIEPPTVVAPVFNADYLENPAPPYPALSRRLGEQGKVILRVLVNAGGTADEVQVRTSSGHARLDETASETVRRWRFAPARRGAEAVPAWVLIPISFRLES